MMIYLGISQSHNLTDTTTALNRHTDIRINCVFGKCLKNDENSNKSIHESKYPKITRDPS